MILLKFCLLMALKSKKTYLWNQIGMLILIGTWCRLTSPWYCHLRKAEDACEKFANSRGYKGKLVGDRTGSQLIAADRRLTHHRDLPTGSPQSQSLRRFTLGSPSTGRQLEDVEWLQS